MRYNGNSICSKGDNMARFEPFPVIRPRAECAQAVCAPPYDTMDREEASRIANDHLHSFIRITRSEVELPDEVDPYSEAVYERAARNLKRWLEEGILEQEPVDCYMIYRQTSHNRTQTGIVGLASVEDYAGDIIRRHELTREEKQLDRTRHIEACSAHTEPVFLTYRSSHIVDVTVKKWIAGHEPLFDFTGPDGTIHRMWRVDNPHAIDVLRIGFEAVPLLYIADGHHRAASAVAVARHLQGSPAGESAQYFPAVCFPSFDLEIMDYNRVVADLNGHTPEAFISSLERARFRVRPVKGAMRKLTRKGVFGMYLGGNWHILERDNQALSGDPVDDLDVSILQDRILHPILGIEDPRTDGRIDFVGGIRGLLELERIVDSGRAAVAFALCPLSMDELLSVADAGRMMPPKSTWFEPKLASGLVLHAIE